MMIWVKYDTGKCIMVQVSVSGSALMVATVICFHCYLHLLYCQSCHG